MGEPICIQESGVEKVEDPRDFVLNRPSSTYRITRVENATLTEEDWVRITSPDDPDIHTKSYFVQLDYRYKGKIGHYLKVDDTGQVTVKGNKDDYHTFFDVIHNMMTDKYQIIRRGPKDKHPPFMILYMDGTKLKARPYNLEADQDDASTMFTLHSKSPKSNLPPYEITSKSGVPLRFDKKGKYSPPTSKVSNSDPPCNFEIYKIETMFVTCL